MFDFAKIYIRSIVGIVSASAVIIYLHPTDSVIIGGYLTAVVSMVLFDKGIPEAS